MPCRRRPTSPWPGNGSVANRAGKTTLFNVMVGAIKPGRGTVRLAGTDITGRPPHRVVHAGPSRTFQLMRPFTSMSVLENVSLSARDAGMSRRDANGQVAELIDRVGLGPGATPAARICRRPD